MNYGKHSARFAADRMLGKLSKWLRIIGQDVLYGPHLTGYGLIHTARQQNRLILTRDRRLKQKQPPSFLLIESDHHRDQLRQVVRACGVDPMASAFTRCITCNAALEPCSKKSAENKIPPFVYATQERFFFCPQCRRVYWPGTHHEKMLAEIRTICLSEPRN